MPLSSRRSLAPAIIAILATLLLMIGYAFASHDVAQASASIQAPGATTEASSIGERASVRTGNTAVKVPAAGHFLDAPRLPGTTPAKQRRAKAKPAVHASGPLVQKGIDCAKVKCVALTFDDGPGPGTPRVLKALEKAGAKATFFVVGSQAAAHPDIVKATAEAGMEIGNHTWDHPQLSRADARTVKRQIQRTQAAIKRASGVTPLYLRPPYGDVSRNQRQKLAMPLAFWDVDTEDWKTRSTRATVSSAAAARPGDIVLMHDIHSSTVDAVPAIIKQLQRRGFHLVTLSTLVGGHPQEHVGYGRGLAPGVRR
ncbi:MAG: polysaccharide deacetylase family protein [Arthrobacter sp.]|jgi:peptidoglycan/xylan/chitin deacetylase (PgdA/CDA1 family)|nr:polysaccharide deacetylase family protein [Arthrobacter sp.]